MVHGAVHAGYIIYNNNILNTNVLPSVFVTKLTRLLSMQHEVAIYGVQSKKSCAGHTCYTRFSLVSSGLVFVCDMLFERLIGLCLFLTMFRVVINQINATKLALLFGSDQPRLSNSQPDHFMTPLAAVTRIAMITLMLSGMLFLLTK